MSERASKCVCYSAQVRDAYSPYGCAFNTGVQLVCVASPRDESRVWLRATLSVSLRMALPPGMDLLGCVLVGTITSLGGGTVRDLLIGLFPLF